MKSNQDQEKNADQEKQSSRQKQEQSTNSDRQPDSQVFRSRRAFLGLGKVTDAFRSRRESLS